ncbi:Smr/MutS family protein [Sphingomonas sp. ID0503]|uniref:Smr/MutS family protein n=1 Tax=Sphingomonas sp. ID0503 TaxID=3399691 RepID=UPI003AFA70BC
MAGRRLDPDEQALWRRVTDSVRPLVKRVALAPSVTTEVRSSRAKSRDGQQTPVVVTRTSPSLGTSGKIAKPGETLDASWDRRLSRGLVAPDISIDLHGHTLASAHALLESSLSRAVAEEARLILLVTGKPPVERHDALGPRRGAIRAAVGDWLAGSAYASRIAAVRNAHPRHGGQGALYIVLRRRR